MAAVSVELTAALSARPADQENVLDILVGRGAFAQASAILSRLPTDDARLRTFRIGVALGQRDSTTAMDELGRRMEEDPSDAKAMAGLPSKGAKPWATSTRSR